MSNQSPPPPPSRPAAADPRARIIAVASGKGGVGKTWFAVTLSHALARAGRKTLLFDGDLGLANVDIQLGLMPKRDLSTALDGKGTLKSCITRHQEAGFDIIAGRSGSGSLASLPAPRIERLQKDLIALAADYDRVVIDLGAGVDRTVRQLATRTGRVLLVVNEEPTSLTDAYAFMKLLWAKHPDTDIRIVVNAAEGEVKGRKTYETLAKACRNFLKREPELAGIVRRDTRVREAIRNQMSLLSRSPGSDAGADVERIAGTL
ncbi:MinD/ParA family protein [Marivibrio halodurans]|uniref:MinD/ParA family protein n=1 Tax=Marivibrio halodurans TaxID=2039722 RepID=A0A8J7SKB7_9PROT|nr:MinD/ParA family protein [Marivibrio halodurans]MBP5856113.1 MinD/ParA family protein [Marivibrio halodurans]